MVFPRFYLNMLSSSERNPFVSYVADSIFNLVWQVFIPFSLTFSRILAELENHLGFMVEKVLLCKIDAI